jgi:hypothetical protein
MSRATPSVIFAVFVIFCYYHRNVFVNGLPSQRFHSRNYTTNTNFLQAFRALYTHYVCSRAKKIPLLFLFLIPRHLPALISGTPLAPHAKLRQPAPTCSDQCVWAVFPAAVVHVLAVYPRIVAHRIFHHFSTASNSPSHSGQISRPPVLINSRSHAIQVSMRGSHWVQGESLNLGHLAHSVVMEVMVAPLLRFYLSMPGNSN